MLARNCYLMKMQLMLNYLAIFIQMIFFQQSEADGVNLCPEVKACICTKNVDMIGIKCTGLRELSEVQNLLQTRFSNVTINNLYLKDCFIKNLPSEAFGNATIRTLMLKCPLQDVADDAFVGNEGMIQLKLFNAEFTRIPRGICALYSLKGLWITKGKLQELDTELHNLTNLLFLSLAYNSISNVSQNAFQYTVKIRRLYLSHNHLTELDPYTFKFLTNLQEIYLAGNHLSGLEDIFQNLNPQIVDLYANDLTSVDDIFHPDSWSVKELYFGNNPLGNISASAFSGRVNNIEVLDLSATQLKNLDPDLFQSLPLLRQLDLRRNKLGNIPKNVFRDLTTLEILRLDGDEISSIEDLFRSVPQMLELHLTNNDITAIGNAFHFVPEVSLITLNKNRIKYIEDDDFKSLPQLTFLDLRYNDIQWLSKKSFHNLNKLESLTLASNHISSLNHSIQNLLSLSYLYLSYNDLFVIGADEFIGLPNVQNISLFGNKLRSVDGAFATLSALRNLNLAKNKLTTLSNDSFVRPLRFATLLLAKGNKWICDCRLLWLIQWLKDTNYSSLQDDPLCHSPMRIRLKSFRAITIEDLTSWPEDCPDPCQCECVPGEKRGFYVRANCSHRKRHAIPPILPQYLGELNMEYNILTNVTNISSASLLQILNLENNFLSVFNLPLLSDLKILRLAANNLTRFPWSLYSNHSLEKVTLSKNPWICDCDTVGFRRWLIAQGDKVIDVNQTRCGPKDRTDVANKVITFLSEKDICPTKMAIYVIVAIGSLSSLLVMSALGLAYSRYHLNIKVWLYAHGVTWVKEEDLDVDKQFDAFVSYSSRDEDFVVTELVKGLEEKFPEVFLCLHYKHFQPGEYIQTNIINAVSCSKRTIMVLSQNFLSSEWCMLEFRAAYVRVLEDKLHRLVIVRYGDLPPVADMDPSLQVYLDSTTYLNWGEKYFWEKLHYALPKKKVRKQKRSSEVSVNCSERTPLLDNK